MERPPGALRFIFKPAKTSVACLYPLASYSYWLQKVVFLPADAHLRRKGEVTAFPPTREDLPELDIKNCIEAFWNN